MWSHRPYGEARGPGSSPESTPRRGASLYTDLGSDHVNSRRTSLTSCADQVRQPAFSFLLSFSYDHLCGRPSQPDSSGTTHF